MKIYIYTILILVALIFAVTVMDSKPTSADLAVLYDVTDKHLARPHAEEIIRLYDFSESRWNGGIFHFVDLSDVSYTRTQEKKIEPVGKWLSNEIQRDKDIENFQKGITEIIYNAEHEVIGKNHSSIYLPIARELNKLSQSKSEKRVLLVYSDLMENRSALSFYNNKTFQLLKSDPDRTRNFFEVEQPLNSLTGIEVYLLFQPVDTIQDDQFKVVSEFYRKLLNDKGAQVTVSANL